MCNTVVVEFKIVNGKPRYSESQRNDERANQFVEDILTTRMADNETNKRSEGIRFVQ